LIGPFFYGVKMNKNSYLLLKSFLEKRLVKHHPDWADQYKWDATRSSATHIQWELKTLKQRVRISLESPNHLSFLVFSEQYRMAVDHFDYMGANGVEKLLNALM
jgi:hypothetical protein